MGDGVFINNRSAFHKGSAGKSMGAMPDVCIQPPAPPAPPVQTRFPNNATAADLTGYGAAVGKLLGAPVGKLLVHKAQRWDEVRTRLDEPEFIRLTVGAGHGIEADPLLRWAGLASAHRPGTK